MTARDHEGQERWRSAIPTRAPPPSPRRLSRKVLAMLAGAVAFAIAGALTWSLGAGRRHVAPPEAVSVVHRQDNAALADAPTDYGDLARKAAAGIGPPAAPSEPAGRGMDDGPFVVPPPSDNRVDAEAERRRHQRESARASGLFAMRDGRSGSAARANPDAAMPHLGPSEALPADAADARDRKAAFVAGAGPTSTVNGGRLMPPASRYMVMAGSTIAAALITGLSSDLPGQVVAQVTEDVFDSISGQTRLIPQGTRLLGSYDARVAYGQSRALLVWTRMILPDGRSLELDRMAGTDGAGLSGLSDRVDNHWGAIVKAGLLSTLLGFGTQINDAGDDDAIVDAIRDSTRQTMGRAGDRIVEHQLAVPPTITVRPGARVRVLVSKDILLPAWDDQRE